MKYLMVCLGNICRSPMAEGILKKELEMIGSNSSVESRGFEPYHNGDYADKRAIETAAKNGVDISKHRAKLFAPQDFDNFDIIYVMDRSNYSDVVGMARNKEDLKKVQFIMNVPLPGSDAVIPDPYYGGGEGFEKAWKMLKQASEAILNTYEKNPK